jgi:hypothetical protein
MARCRPGWFDARSELFGVLGDEVLGDNVEIVRAA